MNINTNEPPLRAVVLAGGCGRRLQEMVRRYTNGRQLPKQFCSFGRSRTLLQATVARVSRHVGPTRVMVVVDQAWEEVAQFQLHGFVGIEILSQPRDRGTGTGLLLPVLRLLEREPEAIVLVAPADHGILDESAFWRGVLTARDAVVSGRAPVVLLGAVADAPRTDYGWIVPGLRSSARLQPVAGFVEKPPPAHARRLLRAGALWNTLVLVARATALLDLFHSRRPVDVALLREACSDSLARGPEGLRRAYERLTHVDFSRDILASAPDLSVFRWPTSVGWSDLGSPDRMSAFLRHERGFNGEVAGRIRSKVARCASRGGHARARGWTMSSRERERRTR